MKRWSRIAWSEAEQVVSAIDDVQSTRWPANDVGPTAYFDSLVRMGALDLAITFLSIAFLQDDAIRWAHAVMKAVRRPGEDDYRDALFSGIERWLDDPTETQRRKLWSDTIMRNVKCPERLLAGAIFFSGNSIAPQQGNPVYPPREICGKLTANAIIALADASLNRELVLRTALDFGERMACEVG